VFIRREFGRQVEVFRDLADGLEQGRWTAGKQLESAECGARSAERGRAAAGLFVSLGAPRSAFRMPKVALVMMTLVSVSNKRCRKNSATSTGAAFKASWR